MFRSILSLAASTALVTTGAMAQEPAAPTTVETVKTAPAAPAYGNVYGIATLRNYQKFQYKKDLENTVPANQGRFTLGSKLANDRVDASITFFAQRDAGTNKVRTPSAPEVLVEWTALKSDNFDFVPYVDMYLARKDAPANGDLGAFGTVKAEQLTLAGNLSWKATADVSTNLVGGRSYVDVERRPEHRGATFSLLGSRDPKKPEALQTQQQDLGLLTEYSSYVALDVAGVEGLSLTTGVLHSRLYSPTYVTNPKSADQVDKNGYKTDAETETLFDVTYKLTEALALSNTAYYYTNGFFQGGVQTGEADSYLAKGNRFVNRAMLTYTLF